MLSWRLKIDTQSGVTVLIVDDEPDILELMAEEFKHHGHHVIVASSGYEAIEILKRDSFDVIVSDFRMPNGNGMSVLYYANTLSSRPLFFFVSGQADLSVRECIEAGAENFFSKPFDLDNLFSEVEKALKKSGKFWEHKYFDVRQQNSKYTKLGDLAQVSAH